MDSIYQVVTEINLRRAPEKHALQKEIVRLSQRIDELNEITADEIDRAMKLLSIKLVKLDTTDTPKLISLADPSLSISTKAINSPINQDSSSRPLIPSRKLNKLPKSRKGRTNSSSTTPTSDLFQAILISLDLMGKDPAKFTDIDHIDLFNELKDNCRFTQTNFCQDHGIHNGNFSTWRQAIEEDQKNGVVSPNSTSKPARLFRELIAKWIKELI
jgi:hypothetical protein